MCFSATGSIVVAGTLTGLGVASLAHAPARLRLIAGSPLLFAAQQAAEGVVWLTLSDTAHSALHARAVMAFLGVALVVWPVYLPLSLWLPEGNPVRRRALVALGVLGAIVSATSWVLLARLQPEASIAGHSIHYEYASIEFPGRPLVFLFLYILPTVAPFFVSSMKLARTIGLTLIVALLLTILVERETLTSVWCFFAAILSAQVVFAVGREARARALLPST